MLERSLPLAGVAFLGLLAGCQSDRCCLIGHYVQTASTVADDTPPPQAATKPDGQSSSPPAPASTGASGSGAALDGLPALPETPPVLRQPVPAPEPQAARRPPSTVGEQLSEARPIWRPSGIQQVSFQSAPESLATRSADGQKNEAVARQRSQRFAVPKELPGSDASPLRLPAYDAQQPLEVRRSLIRSLFPELPYEVPPLVAGDRADEPMTLSELQQLGLEHSPVVSQAAADVESARGKAIQVGLYPNPTVGYEGDTVGTTNTAGYNGAFISQEFVTAGKLTLAQDSALMAMQAAEADLRKARVSLASNIRRRYFELLLAQERLVFSRALATLSEEVYHAQIDLVAGGENAAYEPLQLRVLAVQARNNVVQADNRVMAAWRQLAATLGLPEMPRTEVAGSIETPAPKIDYESARTIVLSRHSDLIAAQSLISSAQYNLRLQEVTPIPNIELYTAVQHDATTPLDNFSYNLQIGLPVPVFNRNQGNITSAHAQVTRSQQDLIDKRNTLQNMLAEIYGRYASNMTIAASYRTEILQDQVRVYRGIYDRFREAGGDVDFAQIVVAQQTLAQAIAGYLDVLGQQWAATVDLAEILQADDLFAIGGGAEG
ncbi:hypothetical protein GC176_28165 [bacterium]|nr:hypothetical protein [bacterium]